MNQYDDVPEFDEAATISRVDGDRELLLELFSLFFSDSEQQLSAIEGAYATNDLRKVEARAHAMKSALGNIGAARAAKIAATIENIARNDSTEGLQQAVGALRPAVNSFHRISSEWGKGTSGSC
jgi:HPt (histidine-containing phosphotransfer) domain-containing protein